MTNTIYHKIRGKRLLIDTNFLLDYLRHYGDYVSVVNDIIANGVEFTTIDPVLIEYYKGVDTNHHLKVKTELFDKTLNKIYPISPRTIENTRQMSLAYRKDCAQISATDLLLAGTLKEKNKELILLTRNHQDFPTTIFDRIGIINVELKRTVNSYSLIKYSHNKYTASVKMFLKSK